MKEKISNKKKTAEKKGSKDPVKKRVTIKEMEEKHLRLYAEFENYKKRITKERIELLRSAGKEVIYSILPVLDDFIRAEKNMESNTEIKALKEGVGLIHTKLINILKSMGLKPMVSIQQAFNSDLHEALSEIPAPNKEKSGTIIDEVEKGYYLHDKVIRHARVIVAK